jgi:alpha-ribazole phosphatase
LADANHSVKEDERLKELNFGRFEGRFWEENSRTREAEAFFADFVNQPCPGGESFGDLLKRVNDFLVDLAKTGHQQVLIVTHGGVVRALLSIIKGVNPADVFNYQIDYGQLTEFEWKRTLK